jgi:serine/threonine protein kinase
MIAPRFETLKDIFHAARELPAAERPAYLERACGADEPLRREIEALLESDRAADRFIADPPADLAVELFGGAQTHLDVGRNIGQYKLLECIGSGGMGAVYLAERADRQFQMQVAIKLIKRGMDTDLVLRRFQHERQILASLEHPNIARLLDGGSTEDGVPYFVMEYIKGHRIDRYAEEHRLPISERLDLFRQVCGAVSYAHQHLVVHRDLKPSNILATPAGIPKLLDFGIAKIIQPNDSTETLQTMTAVPIKLSRRETLNSSNNKYSAQRPSSEITHVESRKAPKENPNGRENRAPQRTCAALMLVDQSRILKVPVSSRFSTDHA